MVKLKEDALGGIRGHCCFTHTPPVMIITHVGGNDIVSMKQDMLIKKIKKDLNYIASVFPSAKMVLSDILPRRSLYGVENTSDNWRINRAGRQVVRSFDPWESMSWLY